jgi:hypothetical protein
VVHYQMAGRLALAACEVATSATGQFSTPAAAVREGQLRPLARLPAVDDAAIATSPSSQDRTRQVPADGVGPEAMMLERSPAIDFPEHGTDLGVRGVKPGTAPGFPNKLLGALAGGRIFGLERTFSSVRHRHSLCFGRGCTAGESGFRGLQPPRVRRPMSEHGEALPPDQVAGGRPRNAVGSSAAGHPEGAHARARMV